METLFQQLREYSESDIYPYHMPGHKRQEIGDLRRQLSALDITEIEGFDNLHQPEKILKELQEYAAGAYGAEETFYLVGGSTSGILSAVSAAVPRGGKLLIARNCHKSVYHAAYLRQLQISYLYPEVVPEIGICEAVTPKQVEETLEKEKDICAVLIVSPTYEGRIAEVSKIADIVHRYSIPLIVDEAHGAHLGFHPAFASGSSRAGADLVITSVHKTLPAMTQTALLHVNGQLIDRQLLKRYLRIYQSSSPSYVLMASIDNAVCVAKEKGDILFQQLYENWKKMLDKLAVCRALTLWPAATLPEIEYRQHQDIGKLVISVKNTGMTGKALYTKLLQEYGLQMEMACDNYVLAMFTIGDVPEGFKRLTNALLEIDSELEKIESDKKTEAYLQREKECISFARAWDQPMTWVGLQDAVGRYVGEFVNIYPPGTPILVPGELFEETDRQLIEQYLTDGLEVQGISHQRGEYGLMVLSDQASI